LVERQTLVSCFEFFYEIQVVVEKKKKEVEEVALKKEKLDEGLKS